MRCSHAKAFAVAICIMHFADGTFLVALNRENFGPLPQEGEGTAWVFLWLRTLNGFHA